MNSRGTHTALINKCLYTEWFNNSLNSPFSEFWRYTRIKALSRNEVDSVLQVDQWHIKQLTVIGLSQRQPSTTNNFWHSEHFFAKLVSFDRSSLVAHFGSTVSSYLTRFGHLILTFGHLPDNSAHRYEIQVGSSTVNLRSRDHGTDNRKWRHFFKSWINQLKRKFWFNCSYV